MVIHFYSLGMPEFNDRLFHLICKRKSYKFNKPPPQRLCFHNPVACKNDGFSK